MDTIAERIHPANLGIRVFLTQSAQRSSIAKDAKHRFYCVGAAAFNDGGHPEGATRRKARILKHEDHKEPPRNHKDIAFESGRRRCLRPRLEDDSLDLATPLVGPAPPYPKPETEGWIDHLVSQTAFPGAHRIDDLHHTLNKCDTSRAWRPTIALLALKNSIAQASTSIAARDIINVGTAHI